METGQLAPVDGMLPSLHDAHTQAPLTPDFKATPQFASVEVQVSRQEPPATDDWTIGVIGQLVQRPPATDDVPAGQLVQEPPATDVVPAGQLVQEPPGTDDLPAGQLVQPALPDGL